MRPVSGALRALLNLNHLRVQCEQIEAHYRQFCAQSSDCTPICALQPRHRARVSGVLRALTYRPAADKPVLSGQLSDGTGSVDLVWLGRRSIAGVGPGVQLLVEGMAVAGSTRLVIYNPTYTIVGMGQ